MTTVFLSQGKTAIINNSDAKRVLQYKWWYKGGYAEARVAGKKVYLHRFLLGFPFGMEIDHINGNGLDNRRRNLRLATHSQNIHNAKMRKDNTTGFKGICWHGKSKRWQSRIYINMKKITLGYFKTKEEAGAAYSIAAKKYFGDFIRK